MQKHDPISDAAVGGNIFVSYSWNDRDFTQQIITLLRDEGYDPQVDRTDIAPSEAWRSRLSEMITSSDTFLFVLTDDWVGSENCRSEFEEAIASGKRLIPVVPRALSLKPDDTISALNYIYFFNLQPGDGRGFYEGMGDLKRALRHDLERLRLRRRYEDRANGWVAGEEDLLKGDQLAQAESWQQQQAAIEGVPENIANYIAAGQGAREKRRRSERRNRRVLGALGVFALTASLVAAAMAWHATKSIDLAEKDTQALTNAAAEWALGKSELTSATRGPDDPRFDDFLTEAVGYLQTSLSFIEQVKRDGVKPLRVEVGLDLARAQFNLMDYAASLSTISDIQNDLSFATTENHARFFMARTLVGCHLGDSAMRLEALLADAPENVRSVYSSEEVARWAAPHPVTCEGASSAICRADSQCEPSPQDLTQSDTPVVELPLDEVPVEDTDEVNSENGVSDSRSIEVVNAYKVTQVFLHISAEEDRAKAKKLGAQLEVLGYRVLGIELIPAPAGRNRSIRYFYDEQEEQASSMRDLCVEIASGLALVAWADADSYRTISLAGRYGDLPRNRMEIWL